ncbi:hypothetical protein [Gilvimarinus xylanilyticus]|uniref:ApeI dehydratase-like domain-containing protein n=1 Tax=Gilvimarinus xylanilyticus TaxID=2944139 RepID=A0A9X2KUD5_9GAMM|nr:hypothetical protein [Gilvimarinus xylanilyticus]MCP8900132.1 hypothetical protein [Gilvimarinus xylanilyticus]
MIALPDSLRLVEAREHLVRWRFDLTPENPCFQGHFDGLPVLAGVVQVAWVHELAVDYFDIKTPFKSLRSNKFQQLVRPPVTMELTLDYQPAKGLVKFTYHNARGVTAKGALLFAGEGQGV